MIKPSEEVTRMAQISQRGATFWRKKKKPSWRCKVFFSVCGKPCESIVHRPCTRDPIEVEIFEKVVKNFFTVITSSACSLWIAFEMIQGRQTFYFWRFEEWILRSLGMSSPSPSTGWRRISFWYIRPLTSKACTFFFCNIYSDSAPCLTFLCFCQWLSCKTWNFPTSLVDMWVRRVQYHLVLPAHRLIFPSTYSFPN